MAYLCFALAHALRNQYNFGLPFVFAHEIALAKVLKYDWPFKAHVFLNERLRSIQRSPRSEAEPMLILR